MLLSNDVVGANRALLGVELGGGANKALAGGALVCDLLLFLGGSFVDPVRKKLMSLVQDFDPI